MTPDSRDHLSRAVSQAVQELFDAYGVATEAVPRLVDPFASHRDSDHAAVIGFAGPELRGTLILGTSRGALERVIDKSMSALPEAWIVELTNQLMGRIKNNVATFGFDLEMSTPVALSRFAVGRLSPGESPLHLSFLTGRDRLEVWLDARTSRELEWRSSEIEIRPEGSIQLF